MVDWQSAPPWKIGEVHKRVTATSWLASQPESYLSQSGTPEWRSALDQHWKVAAEHVHEEVRGRRINKFAWLASQQAHLWPTLDLNYYITTLLSYVTNPTPLNRLLLFCNPNKPNTPYCLFTCCDVISFNIISRHLSLLILCSVDKDLRVEMLCSWVSLYIY